jgi:hypothetical protein
MSSFTFSKTVTDWEMLMNAVIANADDLAHLEPVRTELAAVLQRAKELGAQQDRILSESQQTSRVIEETLTRGDALAARLRAGVRSKYGYKSEKLTEFQLRPFRRRSRAAEPPPQPEAPAPDPTAAT